MRSRFEMTSSLILCVRDVATVCRRLATMPRYPEQQYGARTFPIATSSARAFIISGPSVSLAGQDPA